MTIEVEGFIAEPKLNPDKSLYRGRLALPGLQWTGSGPEVFATATITLEQIAAAAESNVLWTDQSVQRGIVPTSSPVNTPREIPLSSGYPDNRYIFDRDKADQIAEKLLYDERLFLSPLVWNLRPGTFEAYWSEATNELIMFDGKVYLPDSHHRHQAILKAVRAYRDHPKGYPKFRLDEQLKVELYFLTKEDEGNYFFDKNQRPKPVALSKAYDLSTQDDLSSLAKRVLDRLPELNEGVNRATDRLSQKAPHFMTLSTLREMMKIYADSTEVEETELDGLAAIAADFLAMLAKVRPELRVETPQSERQNSLASSAVMLLGYAYLMRSYAQDLSRSGSVAARSIWNARLQKLAPSAVYRRQDWSGDFLAKENPLWIELGITRRHPDTGRLGISNTGGARSQAGRALGRLVGT